MQLIYARAPRHWGGYALGGKRAFDLLVTLLFAPLWAPLIAFLWLGSWLEGGQGFYSETRIGQGGHPFRCLKIRTLRSGSARDCAAHKRALDPRSTSFGRLLRRSSLDELPQLICVLKGEMSLVGPRPVPASELAYYGACKGAYLALRPGLGGLWQVSGRNDLPYSTRVELDLRYGQALSLREDLRILWLTCREVLRLSGR